MVQKEKYIKKLFVFLLNLEAKCINLFIFKSKPVIFPCYLFFLDVILTSTTSPFSALQVNDLSQQLSTTEMQRDALLSQQADSLEEAERLRGALQATSQEVLEIRKELGAAALREAQMSQQIKEVTQQLALDQEREQADKSRLSAAIHENVLKVSGDLLSWTTATYQHWKSTPLFVLSVT